MTTGDRIYLAMYIWLNLMLIPNCVLGMLIAYYSFNSDKLRDRHPYARHASRMIRRCIVVLVIAGVISATLSAASVYNNCNNPAYVNTWWWYVWGCWMY